MNYYYKYIFTLFSIYFLVNCISAQDINKAYQRGNEAKIKQYDEKNLPLLRFGTKEEEEEEKIKVEGFITKTIDSLSIPLEGLIIIKSPWESQNENYYLFPKESNNFYFFVNTIYFTNSLNVFKESKSSSNKEAIMNVFNYFNSSNYKEKRLDMDFCDGYSMMYLTVLKVENKKIKLFYLDPIDMCKNDNAFEALEGDKIVRWEFGNSE